MENVTFAQKVIKPHTIDPLEGHTVVVLETIGQAGEEFRFEIEPGMRVPKTGLDIFKWIRGGRAGTNYFAYAVNGDPELRMRFATPIRLDNQAHTVTLTGSVAYSVGDPKLLVTRRNDDPLRKLREEIALTLQRQFAPRSWLSVRNEFRDVEREVLDATREPLQRFARTYGLELRDLALSFELDEKDTRDVKHEAEIDQQRDIHKRDAALDRLKISEEAANQAMRTELQHRLAMQQLIFTNEEERLRNEQILENAPLETTVAGILNNRAIGKAATDAAVIAIKNAGGSIQTPAQLVAAFSALLEATGKSRALFGSPGSILQAAPELGQLGAAQTGAHPIVAEMFQRTEAFGWELMKKRQLQSAILHLVAELLADGTGSATVIEQYRGQVEELRSERGLGFDHFEYLGKFVDTEGLRRELH